jgi:hypothetical protein
MATSADRWTATDGEARISLPDPSRPKGVTGASLSCAGQSWSLALHLAPDTLQLAGPVAATLAVGSRTFDVDGAAEPGKVVLRIEGEAMVLLKTGTLMQAAVGPDARISAAFPLRGSKVAIEAAAPFCSRREIPGADLIGLTPDSSHVAEAAELRKDEIELFRKATTAEPVVSAAKSVLPDGRSLLFVELCGSAWYYGASGCNMSIFARASDAVAWSQVYETEGADLYLDVRRPVDGWPSLIAVSRAAGDEALWAWGGDGYAVVENDSVASVPVGDAAGGR